MQHWTTLSYHLSTVFYVVPGAAHCMAFLCIVFFYVYEFIHIASLNLSQSICWIYATYLNSIWYTINYMLSDICWKKCSCIGLVCNESEFDLVKGYVQIKWKSWTIFLGIFVYNRCDNIQYAWWWLIILMNHKWII